MKRTERLAWLTRADATKHLLPAPGPEVVGEMLDEIRCLHRESELLSALLLEWHRMFAPVRRDGTDGAALIDRTSGALWAVGALDKGGEANVNDEVPK